MVRRTAVRIRVASVPFSASLPAGERTSSWSVLTAWDNGIAARFMPKRYTSRELVKLAGEFGWILVGVRGDHHNFKHPASRFIVTIVHPQKDVPVGRAVDTVKKIRLELK